MFVMSNKYVTIPSVHGIVDSPVLSLSNILILALIITYSTKADSEVNVSKQEVEGVANEWPEKVLQAERLGDYRRAIVYCDELISRKAFEVWAWNVRGNCLFALKEFDDALTCYDRALEFPESASDHVLLSNKAGCLEALKRYQTSLEYYEKALQSNRDYETAREGWARVLRFLTQNVYDSQEYRKCLSYCDKLISHKASEVWAWNMRGNCLYALKEFNDALSCYDRALEFLESSNDHIIIYNKANCLLTLKRYEDAVAFFRKALDINPNYVDARQGLRQAENILWWDRSFWKTIPLIMIGLVVFYIVLAIILEKRYGPENPERRWNWGWGR